MGTAEKHSVFEAAALPHLGAAYNLARWLTGNDSDAEDVVQEACLRAFRFFDSFHGGNFKAWLLTVVRHTFYHWHNQSRHHRATLSLDDERWAGGLPEFRCAVSHDLELVSIKDAMLTLSPEFREILVLRELENLSYKELSSLLNLPIGTVMSRLARARAALKNQFGAQVVAPKRSERALRAADEVAG